MDKHRCWLGMLGVALAVAGAAQGAGQRSQSCTPEPSRYRFEYTWEEGGAPQKLRFWIPKETVESGRTEFRSLHLDDPHSATRPAAEALAKKLEAKGGIKFRFDTNGVAVVAENKDAAKEGQALMEFWNEISESEAARQAEAQMYRMEGDGIVEIDYWKVIKKAGASLKDINRALDEGVDSRTARERTSHALGFIQSIPYRRDFANKTDFQTPLGMLTENKGDCDTKAVALAALLGNWGIECILIGTSEGENHMLLGVGIEPEQGEAWLTHKGKRYTLCETTTPGWEPGQVSKNTEEALTENSFELYTDPTK